MLKIHDHHVKKAFSQGYIICIHMPYLSIFDYRRVHDMISTTYHGSEGNTYLVSHGDMSIDPFGAKESFHSNADDCRRFGP